MSEHLEALRNDTNVQRLFHRVSMDLAALPQAAVTRSFTAMLIRDVAQELDSPPSALASVLAMYDGCGKPTPHGES